MCGRPRSLGWLQEYFLAFYLVNCEVVMCPDFVSSEVVSIKYFQVLVDLTSTRHAVYLIV